MAAGAGHILILGLSIALKTFAGQALIAPPEQSFKLTATAELVLLDVSIEDAAGDHVAGLTKNNFQVYEDGKLQTITHFSSDDVPVTVGLVIDKSGSMRPKHENVVTAAIAFVHASNPKDEVFVVNFNDRASFGLPPNVSFTDDVEALRAALSMKPPDGRTAIYDAIVLSLNHLDRGTREKKALVLVSDGGDNSSTHGFANVTQRVQESRATIYTIGLFDDDDKDRNPRVLARLARISGGEAFLPKVLPEVVGICRRIASDIRTRYTVGYVPVRVGEKGSLRKLKVIAWQPGGGKLVVHTRASYFLPESRPAANP
jgi:Ca-activated chloride channel homolog